jgi:DNA-binding CsgD family transcriptional regulator
VLEIADEDPTGDVVGEVRRPEESELTAPTGGQVHPRLAAGIQGGAGPRDRRHGRAPWPAGRHVAPGFSPESTRGYDPRAMLYGRGAERSRIVELLDGARQSRSGVLVIRGEAGVGKSALLSDAHEQAREMLVLTGSGVESEARLPFAGLHQLVRPVLGHVERLPRPQASALEGALGLTAGGGEDRFLVSLAALSLLAEAAERRPVLCLVDDAHWLDDASADALLFVARRLHMEGIVMLFAARDGEPRRFEAPGLPTLHLGGLDPAAAGQLIDRRAGAALSSAVRDRLVAETEGNPLALLELSSTLTEAQLSGAEALLAPIRVSDRVERAFLARVRRLPAETQTLLLVAAADDTGELTTVLRAAAQLGVAGEALDAAEQAGLAQVRRARLELRHPLVRSAVYQGAPLSKRQAVHRALASVLDREIEADRRAWHRAAGSVEPDASVVEELERAAERARRRSAFAAASLAFERAAALTQDEHERARRLTAAGEDAWVDGHTERARMLLQRARPLAEELIERADIDRTLGLIELTRGVPADACRRLVRAAADVAPLDGGRALQLLNLASVGATYTGDRRVAAAIAQLARDLAVEETPVANTLVQRLVGLGAYFEGDFATAAPRLRAALALEEQRANDPARPVSLFFAGRTAALLGDDQALFRSTHAAAAQARADGALGLLTHILTRLGHGELWTGHWGSASASAGEGMQLARELDQPHLVAQQLALLAMIAAHRGAEDDCRSPAADAREFARRYGLAVVADFANWALTLLELGLGQAEDAFRRAREISSTFVVFWAGLDRIEAAIRAGEEETARAWLASFESWATCGGVAWQRAVVLHCHALLAVDPGEAKRLFRLALDAHDQASRPFERARTELAFGEFLRRSRRRLEASGHLRTALDGFETLTATLWAERAQVELRASGQTARRRDPSTRDELSAQELQIARFVAQGLSNREVAAQLFLSPRTIEFHLRNVFRKLGLTSRTQLARLDLDGGT